MMAAALAVSMLFTIAHVQFKPFKLLLDNLLRFTTEVHTVLMIMLANAVKADSQASERQTAYDSVAVGTFAALVALPFLLVVAAKLRAVRNTMRQSLAESKASQAVDVHMAIRRFQLGLQSAEDRQIAMEYLETPGAAPHRRPLSGGVVALIVMSSIIGSLFLCVGVLYYFQCHAVLSAIPLVGSLLYARHRRYAPPPPPPSQVSSFPRVEAV